MKNLLFATLLTVTVLSAAARADSPLETIQPDIALSDVRARPGVVLVDLYADW